jgi:hypothetical protein
MAARSGKRETGGPEGTRTMRVERDCSLKDITSLWDLSMMVTASGFIMMPMCYLIEKKVKAWTWLLPIIGITGMIGIPDDDHATIGEGWRVHVSEAIAAMPELKPYVRTAMEDGRITFTEYRAISTARTKLLKDKSRTSINKLLSSKGPKAALPQTGTLSGSQE